MPVVVIKCGEEYCECPTCHARVARIPGRPVDTILHRCQPQPPSGLGDRVAAVLSAVGITEDRAQAVAKAVGLTDCGCGRRRAAMNRLGEKLGLPPGQTPAS